MRTTSRVLSGVFWQSAWMTWSAGSPSAKNRHLAGATTCGGARVFCRGQRGIANEQAVGGLRGRESAEARTHRKQPEPRASHLRAECAACPKHVADAQPIAAVAHSQHAVNRLGVQLKWDRHSHGEHLALAEERGEFLLHNATARSEVDLNNKAVFPICCCRTAGANAGSR
eukprot:scaffold9484_cov124-Isochrysis_galbana.AAC.17